MAIISVDLLNNSTVTIDSLNANDGDVINITALGSSELIVDGVDVEVGSIAGVQALSAPTFTSTGGANLTIDQGLLNVPALNNFTFNIEDNSHTTLDGSTVTALNGLNSYDVNFSGADAGSFTYDDPDVGIASVVNFNVTGMEAGDQMNLGDGNWQLDDGSILNPLDAFRDGKLHLENGAAGVLQTKVTASIEMTQEEYDEFLEDPSAFLSGQDFTMVCFAAGTRIATPDGECAVEALEIGDMVLTAAGTTVPVKWMGRQTVHKVFTPKERFVPVRVKAGALGNNLPHTDLLVTADHALIIDELAINAGALVNGTTIVFERVEDLPQKVTYYHIETEDHNVVLANGAAAETYVDYIERRGFDNYAEYVDLYGEERTIIEMARPRISSARLLPPSICARLGVQKIA
ncbi:hypothetical protein RA2_02905 [Roseovarius sp. A-2]|uniref:Hint domain-containing protein n=1 Tax=Roseovarius sp. A-2 TaxID=1570360 RepID=UPI0009B522F4|nr:Hint domain-containing protein [Roseovarius sp. A-2]GAW35837.1 hypothetical protein RA2_02905 [Roseovarius sp. A-2]